jgi:diguanylate cyclase (GGDEF)-like protein
MRQRLTPLLDHGVECPFEMAVTEIVDQALDRAERDETPLSVILCDIDHLVAVNLVHGREAGDSLLLQLFVRVCEFVPVEDVIWESNRTDLVIVARQHSLAEAYGLAQKIQHMVSEQMFWVAQKSIMVTVTLGLATHIPGSGRTTAELMATAEELLVDGKARGPNTLWPIVN